MADLLLKEFEEKLRSVVGSVQVIQLDLEQPGEDVKYLFQELEGSLKMLQSTHNDANKAYQLISSALHEITDEKSSLRQDRDAHSTKVQDWEKTVAQKEATLVEREKGLQQRESELQSRMDQFMQRTAETDAQKLATVASTVSGQAIRELRGELDKVKASNDEHQKLSDELRCAEERLRKVSKRDDGLERANSDLQKRLDDAEAQRIKAVEEAEAVEKSRVEYAMEVSHDLGIADGKIAQLDKQLLQERLTLSDVRADLSNAEEVNGALSEEVKKLTQDATQLRTTSNQKSQQHQYHVQGLEADVERLGGEVERLKREVEALETPLSQFAVSRRTGEDAQWQSIVDSFNVLVFDFRPDIESQSLLTLADVMLQMTPLCWSSEGKARLIDFLEEANPKEWYCFQQVVDMGVEYDESMMSQWEHCPLHGRGQCIQIRLGMTRNGHKSIVFRSVIDGVESTTPAQPQWSVGEI